MDDGYRGEGELLDPLHQAQQAAAELCAARGVHRGELLRLDPGAEDLALGPHDQCAHPVGKFIQYGVVRVGQLGREQIDPRCRTNDFGYIAV